LQQLVAVAVLNANSIAGKVLPAALAVANTWGKSVAATASSIQYPATE